MATLAHNAEEIAPRELKPALYELEGISREAVEAHYKLYEGYIAKRNEILARLADVDLESGNQVYSDVRALKVDLTFAIGGVKNHEIYFEHLGGDGGDPSGSIGELIDARLRRRGRVARRPEGDRHGRPRLGVDGVRLGRGPALQLHRRRSELVSDLECDAARGARRLRACVLPRLPDRPGELHRRVLPEPGLDDREQLGLGIRHPVEVVIETLAFTLVGYLAGSLPFGYWVVRWTKGVDIRTVGSGNIGATNVWRTFGPRYGIPVILLDVAKGFVPVLVATLAVGHVAGALAGGAAMLGHWRPLFLGFAKGGKMVATCGGALLGLAPVVGLAGALVWIAVFAVTRYASVASIVAALSLPVSALILEEPWPVLVFVSAAALGVLILHRGNLARLRAGTETRTHLRRKPAATTQ